MFFDFVPFPKTAPFELSKGPGVKRAVLVGINYVGRNGQLSGCQNDVKNMKKYIEDVHKFPANEIEVLMDDGTSKEPSRENLIKALQKLVKVSKEGDSIMFYFSGELYIKFGFTWKLILFYSILTYWSILSDHFTGHGGLLAPEKNEYKNKNNQFDQTLIPVDHESKGQIRDFNLFHHFVRPMSKGVTVTCIMDCCHSGSVLDLPYYFRSDREAEGMEENAESMSNLAFMFAAGGFELPDMFDGEVKDNIEHTTGCEIEEIITCKM